MACYVLHLATSTLLCQSIKAGSIVRYLSVAVHFFTDPDSNRRQFLLIEDILQEA